MIGRGIQSNLLLHCADCTGRLAVRRIAQELLHASLRGENHISVVLNSDRRCDRRTSLSMSS